ncbi:sulfite exporter TauE/SafE family protein [bacterium]|nr:sulfite exporter TauE/SafE family protein [bacterium]
MKHPLLPTEETLSPLLGAPLHSILHHMEQPISIVAIFLASLIGSTHCAGMCGGIAMLCSSERKNGVWGALSYHLMRGLSYLMLGTLAGYFGSSLDLGGEVAGIQRVSAVLAVIVMVIFALRLLRSRPQSVSLAEISTTTPESRKSWFGAIFSPRLHAGTLGFLTGFLPCGWLWVFLAAAAGAADPLQGAIILGVFWLGTLPILISVGGMGSLVARKLGNKTRVLSAILLLTAAGFSLWTHVRLFSPASTEHHHHHHHH